MVQRHTLITTEVGTLTVIQTTILGEASTQTVRSLAHRVVATLQTLAIEDRLVDPAGLVADTAADLVAAVSAAEDSAVVVDSDANSLNLQNTISIGDYRR